MARPKVISGIITHYLMTLAELTRHYAVLRLFDGLETRVNGRLCLDAQVPVLVPEGGQLYCCGLVVLVSYRKGDTYHQELLPFESHYDPREVVELGPARWGQAADTLAYEFISQLVQWTKDKDKVAFSYLGPTTGLKPDRQRYYL